MYPSYDYSVPHRLNQDELLSFFEKHAGDSRMQEYLVTADPEYGIIVQEGVHHSFLIWWPAGVRGYLTDLVVIDVTGLPIVASVNQAPYESPDSSFVQETIEEVRALASSFQSTLNLALLVGVAYLALMAIREYRHA